MTGASQINHIYPVLVFLIPIDALRVKANLKMPISITS